MQVIKIGLYQILRSSIETFYIRLAHCQSINGEHFEHQL